MWKPIKHLDQHPRLLHQVYSCWPTRLRCCCQDTCKKLRTMSTRSDGGVYDVLACVSTPLSPCIWCTHCLWHPAKDAGKMLIFTQAAMMNYVGNTHLEKFETCNAVSDKIQHRLIINILFGDDPTVIATAFMHFFVKSGQSCVTTLRGADSLWFISVLLSRFPWS